MKKLLIIPILLLAGCMGLGSKTVYLPHTSRVVHTKKSCPGCIDPSPITYPTIQAALGTGGITACSVCVKGKSYGKKVQGQGYTVTNYSGIPGNTPSSRFAPSSIGSSALKVIKAGADSMSDVYKNRQPYASNLNNIYTQHQMRQQTSIMQQQLDLQRAQQRNTYTPIQPIQPTPSVTNVYNSTPRKTNQWQPMDSPFKGNGILGN
jgi:hypothetical protein